ncbi:MAG: hypothetical protein HYS09_06215 [Chloroflexi bacterium]|nr:hypothetical protein [Chloroflexota bacterium]
MAFYGKDREDDEQAAMAAEASESPESTDDENAEAPEDAPPVEETVDRNVRESAEIPAGAGNGSRETVQTSASVAAVLGLTKAASNLYIVLVDSNEGVSVNPFLRAEDAETFIGELVEAGHPIEKVAALKARSLVANVAYRPVVALEPGGKGE